MYKFLLELDDLCKKHNVSFKYKTDVIEQNNYIRERIPVTSTRFTNNPTSASSYYEVDAIFCEVKKSISIEFFQKIRARLR